MKNNQEILNLFNNFIDNEFANFEPLYQKLLLKPEINPLLLKTDIDMNKKRAVYSNNKNNNQNKKNILKLNLLEVSGWCKNSNENKCFEYFMPQLNKYLTESENNETKVNKQQSLKLKT